MQPKFSRLSKILSEEVVDILETKTVLILGCGGVGGYVIESLARSNIGRLIIVDFDTVDITNINRQIIALDSTIGQKKVDVFEKRIKEINNKCEVIKIDQFIDENNIDILFEESIDYLVDACDSINTKKKIIDICLDKKIPFISSMGTGNKLDPSKLEITDIRKTENDPLARIIRKYIRDKKIKDKITVLSSKEIPIKTHDKTPGSTAFVPSSAGLLIASYVFKKLIEKNKTNV